MDDVHHKCLVLILTGSTLKGPVAVLSTRSFRWLRLAFVRVLLVSLFGWSTLGWSTLALAQSQDAPPPSRLTPRLRPRPPAGSPTQAPAPSPAVAPAPSRAPVQTEPARAAASSPTPAPSTVGTPPPAAARPAPTPALPSASASSVVASTLTLDAASPPLLPAFKKQPAPAGYVDHYRRNSPLIVSGALTLGITYIASLAVGGKQGFKDGMGALAVPVLGPWLAIGGRKVDCEVSTVDGLDDIETSTDETAKCFSKEAATIAVLTGMGIGQLIGAVLITAGVLDRRHFYLRSDLAGLSFTPVVGPTNFGWIMRGTL